MNTLHTDVVILGAGTSGLNARSEVDKAGKDWILVEAGPYGTTCARVGCMPSKLLIAAADAAHEARHADTFGVHAGEITLDGPAIFDRVRRERDRFAGFVVRATEALPAERRVRGFGRFVGPTTIHVDDHTRIEASSVVIATGSSPWTPPGYEAVADRLLVNDDIFELEDLPASLAVIGTGIIGLELGQALHRLGVEVHFFNPFESLAGIQDPEVYKVARQTFADEFPLHLNAKTSSAEPTDDGGVRIRWTAGDGAVHDKVFAKVLVAAGRRPNITELGLDALGVELGRFGVPAHDPSTMQVGELPIFIAGDVTAQRALLHEASDEGRIAGANAARFPDVTAGHRRVPLAIAFTDPQLAFVGTPYADLPSSCTVFGEVSYSDQGRARVMGKNRGIVRLYADRNTEAFVGATLFGPRAEHMAHLLAWAIASNLTVIEVLERPFYHPVLEEGLRTAFRDLAKNLRVMGRCPPEDCADAPGE